MKGRKEKMNNIEMIPIIGSSNVDSIGYDATEQVLRVKFIRGDVYDYKDVPAIEFEQFKSASSVGKYLAQNIKGKYSYERID